MTGLGTFMVRCKTICLHRDMMTRPLYCPVNLNWQYVGTNDMKVGCTRLLVRLRVQTVAKTLSAPCPKLLNVPLQKASTAAAWDSRDSTVAQRILRDWPMESRAPSSRKKYPVDYSATCWPHTLKPLFPSQLSTLHLNQTLKGP